MFSSGKAGSRIRLGRVPTSIMRTRARRSHSSTPRPSSNYKYSAIAGCASIPVGIWWATRPHEPNHNGSDHDDDVPRIGSAPDKHLGVKPGPDKDQVTRMLSRAAYSLQVTDITGVTRYDGTQLASNSPCEDRFVHGKLDSPWNDGPPWMAWAVFDGHAGWQTAELLKDQLLPHVRHSLGHNITPPPSNHDPLPPTDESIQRAIKQGFVTLDDAIIKPALNIFHSQDPLQNKIKTLAPAYAGSCALLSMYDPRTSTLHVACTGDSRAVLGQKRPDGTWHAIPLSIDQTGYNEDEVARLSAEHPGEEETIVKDGRVLGLAVSRAFGDSRWKWPLDFQEQVKRGFYAPAPLTPRYEVQTPPYLTAEPVVTSTKIDPSTPSFLIMATDGMWDMLSSQQGVELVGQWLESRTAEQNVRKPEEEEPAYAPFNFSRFWEDTTWKFEEGRKTVQDDNAAVHLVRNALGGNHHELIAGRLAFSPPFSRNVRDDVTVQVVFFGDLGRGRK
ncbi:protein serine/threonine phosphatase 2C [Aspergillus ellipticus CBS 707.79]|uniref:Protein serine/threonine phosphatase 2C n=1 Tax=Aspergillus ellipticus CBS 707.79 TaxID=1448320 RepID=A0A319D720_9EURO|nr:protein serine/threonine phosphatase 2C [Aspergillus ellipticus CBS 707.79]